MQEECTQAVSMEEGRSQLRKTESALERKRKQEKKKKKQPPFQSFLQILLFLPFLIFQQAAISIQYCHSAPDFMGARYPCMLEEIHKYIWPRSTGA